MPTPSLNAPVVSVTLPNGKTISVQYVGENKRFGLIIDRTYYVYDIRTGEELAYGWAEEHEWNDRSVLLKRLGQQIGAFAAYRPEYVEYVRQSFPLPITETMGQRW